MTAVSWKLRSPQRLPTRRRPTRRVARHSASIQSSPRAKGPAWRSAIISPIWRTRAGSSPGAPRTLRPRKFGWSSRRDNRTVHQIAAGRPQCFGMLAGHQPCRLTASIRRSTPPYFAKGRDEDRKRYRPKCRESSDESPRPASCKISHCEKRQCDSCESERPALIHSRPGYRVPGSAAALQMAPRRNSFSKSASTENPPRSVLRPDTRGRRRVRRGGVNRPSVTGAFYEAAVAALRQVDHPGVSSKLASPDEGLRACVVSEPRCRYAR